MLKPETPSKSSLQRRAVIDVGTNSVKLLVGDFDGVDVIPVCEESKQTRLGRGFYETHLLQAEPIAATAEAVRKLAAKATAHGASSIRVFATSAARDALNAKELLDAICASSGLAVEIISGEQEADWVFSGVASDPALAGAPLLIMDVGGGSTEFVLGRGTQQYFRNSFRLGTVRLLEQIQPADPPSATDLVRCRTGLKEFLLENILPSLRPALEQCPGVRLIGTGGTTTILARMEKALPEFDRDQIDATRLTLNSLRTHVEKTWSLSLEERRKIVGLPPKRADVILTGLAIYEVVMEQLHFDELRVSTRGLRFAALAQRPVT